MSQNAFFINPAAGSGRAARVWRALQERYPDQTTAAAECGRVVVAANAAESREGLDRLLTEESGLRRLVIVGGDGSVHLAVNALLAAGAEEAIALSLVPAGTGSDLARTLGLPRRLPRALEVLKLAAEPDAVPVRRLDVLRLRSDEGEVVHSINVLSVGISGLVDLQVNAQRRRGTLAFLQASITAVWRYRAQPCRIEADGEVIYDGPLYLLAVGNGRYFGKGMKGLPQAVMDDGRADVLVVPPKPRAELLGLRLPQLYLGRHLGAKGLIHLRARTIRVGTRGDFPPFDLDGETYPVTAGKIEVMERVIRWQG